MYRVSATSPSIIDTDSAAISASVVAAFLDLGFLNAGTPLEIASTPVSAAEPEEKPFSSRKTSAKPVSDVSACMWKLALCGLHVGADDEFDQPGEDHREDREDERVDRNGEGRAGFPDAAQVRRADQDDDADREPHRMVADDLDRRADVGHPGGRRDGHRQDVVDQQRAGHQQPVGRPEVLGDHLVVAAAAGVRVHILPVRQHHDDHHQGDQPGDPRCVGIGREAGHRQHREDFLRRVRDAGQRVGGEHRQRDPLRQQRVRQPVAAERPADQQTLGGSGQFGHRAGAYGPKITTNTRVTGNTHRTGPHFRAGNRPRIPNVPVIGSVISSRGVRDRARHTL